MEEDDDVLVKFEAEETVPEPETPETPEVDPAAELKAQYEAEKSRREAAETRAQEERRAAQAERQRASQAEARVADSELSSVTSRSEAAQAEADNAEAEYVAALDKGDHAAAAKAQRKIARAEAEMLRLSEAKADLEARKTAPREEPKPEQNSFDKYVSQFTEPTQRWMRDHKDWVTDPAKSQKLQKAHFHALGEGLDVDTPEYFEHVEKRIGLREEKPVVQEKPKRSASPPVAPVSTGASSSMSSNGNTVTLSKREATAATDGTLTWNYDDPKGKYKKGDPIGVQEFAKRKQAMMKQGLYDKSLME